MTSRRNAMAAMAASVALAGLGAPVGLAARGGPVRFPKGPVRLRRVLERGLGDGISLTVSRDWECHFLASQNGASIRARQVLVDVDAPQALAALAQLEKAREVAGLFPMQLDDSGLIVGWAGQAIDLDKAVVAARRAIDGKKLAGSGAQEAKRYVAEMGKTAAELVSQVPRDLFYPHPGQRHEKRALDLPNGAKGTYELTVEARTAAGSGLLDTSERRIVTRIGDSTRISRESWSII
ncbi:hypothetical protein [Qipengyuania sphaerica]|uniref:hypothetical protein n=1 Tax=Qipengyuania sphaerica TaxID=2867243 RepID=UPI001C87C3D8|nr:hypothetical protein [Qipengyuania sphaerica]MBX7541554.1 hypothetical protein [Qipengyuania sphaerica]